MGSPGAGKTSLILNTIKGLNDRLRIAVVEADLDSVVDSEKIAACGVKAVQIKTGGFCHIDASMTEKALQSLPLDDLDLIILENVGNLVCPAETDTGAVKNIVVLSVPEGDDKPLKYPFIFSICDALVVSKTDYLELTDFDFEKVKKRVSVLNRKISYFSISCKTTSGVDKWNEWLEHEIKTYKYE